MALRSLVAGISVAAVLGWTGVATAAENPDVAITVNRVIYPGQTVTADAIVETPMRAPLDAKLQVVRDAASVVGMVAARTILPKRLISLNALRAAYAVEVGEPTTVYYRNGSLTIAMDAVALQSAGYGDTIRVRNVRSGRTITGTVMPDGTVSVEAR